MDAKQQARRLLRAAGLDGALAWGEQHWPSKTMRRERRDNRHAVVALAARLRPDSNCVDVGAHEGSFLAHMLRLAPEGSHVACEPLPDYAARLRSGFPGVTLHEAALSDAEGTASFAYVPELPGYSGLRDVAPGEHTVQSLTVRTARLDDLLDADLPIEAIKIDVEGAELGVLDGAERTLQRWRPMVLIEHGISAHAYGTTPHDVHGRLAAAGLRVFDLDGDGPLSADDVAARIAAGRTWNWLAH
jgi:FkbM family methyltransferase